VLEDVAGPLAGKIDADLIAMAQEFESISYPQLLNFGDPSRTTRTRTSTAASSCCSLRG
jgi:hypothetical protein